MGKRKRKKEKENRKKEESTVIPKTKSAKKCYGSTSIVALVAQDIKAAPC